MNRIWAESSWFWLVYKDGTPIFENTMSFEDPRFPNKSPHRRGRRVFNGNRVILKCGSCRVYDYEFYPVVTYVLDLKLGESGWYVRLSMMDQRESASPEDFAYYMEYLPKVTELVGEINTAIGSRAEFIFKNHWNEADRFSVRIITPNDSRLPEYEDEHPGTLWNRT